jgi:hypothetical protein
MTKREAQRSNKCQMRKLKVQIHGVSFDIGILAFEISIFLAFGF